MLEKHIWEALPRQLLEEVLEPEMAKQYRLRRGEQCRYMPVVRDDRWLCSCGEENETGCICACGLEAQPITRQLLEELSREAEARLQQEEQERLRQEQLELEARKQAEAKAKREKRKRILIGVGIGLGVLALAAGLGLLTWRVILPEARYKSGMRLLEKGEYAKAYGEFLRAGDHEKAKKQLERFYVPVASQHTKTVYNEDYDWSGLGITPGDTEMEIRYRYDKAGRLVETVESDGETQTYTCTYDEAGRVLTKEAWDGKSTYTYDDRGSVLTLYHEYTGGNYSYAKTWSYVYDDQGRILSSMEVCNDFITVNYSYESRIRNTYDDKGRLIRRENEVNYPATADACYTTVEIFEYDSEDRPVRCDHSIVFPFNPTEDGAGRETWTYDSRGRQIGHTIQMRYPDNPYRDYVQEDRTVYDGEGRVTEEVSVWHYPGDPQRDYQQGAYTEFDSKGRVIRQKWSIRYEDTTRQDLSGKEQVDTYTYDRLGRKTEHVQEYTARPEQCYRLRERFSYKGMVVCESKAVCVYPEDEDENWESATTYDENGQIKTQYQKEASCETTTEYTYAYFYIPEGTPFPEEG